MYCLYYCSWNKQVKALAQVPTWSPPPGYLLISQYELPSAWMNPQVQFDLQIKPQGSDCFNFLLVFYECLQYQMKSRVMGGFSSWVIVYDQFSWLLMFPLTVSLDYKTDWQFGSFFFFPQWFEEDRLKILINRQNHLYLQNAWFSGNFKIIKEKGHFVLTVRLEQEETFPSTGRLESATRAQLGERFQETDAPHGMFSEKAGEISLMFILSASADWALISSNMLCMYHGPFGLCNKWIFLVCILNTIKVWRAIDTQ